MCHEPCDGNYEYKFMIKGLLEWQDLEVFLLI